jgi:hypothetical protein
MTRRSVWYPGEFKDAEPLQSCSPSNPQHLISNLHDMLCRGEQILLSEVSEVDTPPKGFSSGTNPNFGDMETPPSLQVPAVSFLIGANLFHTPTSVEHRESVQVPVVPLTMTLQQLEKSIVEFSVVLRGLLIHSCKETCTKGKEEPSRSCNPGPRVKIAEAPSSGKAGCPNNRGSTRGTIELQEHAALVR